MAEDAKNTGGMAQFTVTMRDYFAAKALGAIIAHTELVEDGMFIVGPAAGTNAIDNFAQFSYLCADAMLRAREVKA